MAADNTRPDGWTPTSIEKASLYTSANATRHFGWSDARTDDARGFAAKFVERFPEAVRAAVVHDWAYAGWFISVFGWAENGQLPVLYGGRNYELKIPATPMPLLIQESDSEFVSDTGYPLIAHDDLAVDDLPPPNANYELLWPFCLPFDGYRASLLLERDCEGIANETLQAGLDNASMEELRITAFIRQRPIKWGDKWPPDEKLLRNVRDVIEEIRRRLTFTQNMPRA